MAPAKVINSIEKHIRKFLWDESADTKKHHWMGWRNVSKHFKIGGLGIRNLKHMNRSLLQKWWWRLGKESKALWARVLADKYGLCDFGWRTNQPKEKHGVSLWRNIYSTSEDLFKLCQFKIGKGDEVRLWEDKWHVQGPLSVLCPKLYHLSSNKNTSILEAREDSVDGLNWNLELADRRRLYDPEIAELTILLPLVDAIELDPLQDDQLIWLGDKKGKFSVKAAYECYSQGNSLTNTFPKSKIWSRAWPQRVGFFLWQAFLGRLPTMDNLHSRHSNLNSSILSKLCNNYEEFVDHLLINCTYSVGIWNYFLDCAHICNTTPRTVKEVVVDWKSLHFS